MTLIPFIVCKPAAPSISKKCRIDLGKAQEKMTEVMKGVKQDCEGEETA